MRVPGVLPSERAFPARENGAFKLCGPGVPGVPGAANGENAGNRRVHGPVNDGLRANARQIGAAGIGIQFSVGAGAGSSWADAVEADLKNASARVREPNN